MDAILQSFLLVFASEIGDKTQLLALVLVSRFHKPWTIMAGILVATILNHALAAFSGNWIAAHINHEILRWVLGIIFFVFAAWILIPDKDNETSGNQRFGAFLTTLITFFLAEMGDKTQLATIALGAKFASIAAVTFGTTLGMLAADGLAVFFGEKLTKNIPLKNIRITACVLFILFGISIIFGFRN